MLRALKGHRASNFRFLWTGDELSMFYEYHHETLWAASREKGDELERRMHYQRKTMGHAF
jgi:hypothetical protein